MSDEKQTEEQGRKKSDVKLDDLLGGDLKLTGADLPDGSYPAILFGFSEPFEMKQSEKFKKEGQPAYRTLFDLRFGLRDKQGTIVELTYMVGIPDGGEVNRKSNLYKAIVALAAGDAKIVDPKTGNLQPGIKLPLFVGRPCVLGVKKNAKEFPQIDTVAGPMDGAKYPTLEECKSLLTSSEGIPF